MTYFGPVTWISPWADLAGLIRKQKWQLLVYQPKRWHIVIRCIYIFFVFYVTVYVPFASKCLHPIRFASRQASIDDKGTVYKIGPHSRHWDVFAEKCINNHTIRHGTKGGGGAEPIVYCFRKMHHAVPCGLFYSFEFLSPTERLFGDDRVWPYHNGY